ncbi:MAG: hypothetical protein JSS49_27535 [Planctomycetes bacterium]|nr:hypothetical protein [Planctomycetota bacterium]
MLKHPDEETVAADVQMALEPFFDLARRAYFHWLTHGKDYWLSQSLMDYRVLSLSMALDIQACRLFRSLVDACKRADSLTANILARSLFETSLAMQFLLRPRIPLFPKVEVDKHGKAARDSDGRKKYVVTTKRSEAVSGCPRREIRAAMYCFRVYFDNERKAVDLKRLANEQRNANKIKPSRKRIKLARKFEHLANAFTERGVPNDFPPLHKMMKRRWYAIQKHGKSYSGLNVKELCFALGDPFTTWYMTIYHIQSNMVHATEGLSHLDLSGDDAIPRHFSTAVEVSRSLYFSTASFLACLKILQKEIGFGCLNEMAVAGLYSEWKGLFKQLPDAPSSDDD